MKPCCLTILLVLAACRSHSETVVSESHSDRRADTVATLAALSMHSIDREQVWERVVMLADAETGELRVTEREIVMHTDKGETVKADTVARKVEAVMKEETINKTENKTVTTDEMPRWRKVAIISTLFLICVFGVLVFAKYLLRLWTSRH